MKIYQAKIYCATDQKYEYFWCDESQLPYSTCPVNQNHSVSTDSFSIERELLPGEKVPSGDLKKYSAQANIESVITSAVIFGQNLMNQYAAENVLLGITQAGMTSTVRARMAGVLAALQTGSLYDVITQSRAIPAEHKDNIFITNARLLAFINKVEAYLGIPISTEL